MNYRLCLLRIMTIQSIVVVLTTNLLLFTYGFVPSSVTKSSSSSSSYTVSRCDAALVYNSRNYYYNYQESSVVRYLSSTSSSLLSEDDTNTEDDNDKLNTISKPPDEIGEGSHDELMYTLGVNLARQLGDITPLVDNGKELAQVAKGLLDTIVGRLSEDGQRNLLLRRGKELNTLISDRAQKIKDVLEKAGRDMLEQMEQTAGSIKLETGVVLQLLEPGPAGPGKGVRPTKSSTVLIHYHGTLADGTIFDTTLGGEPVKFPLAAVIPGWRDGVLKMHEGEIAMIGIPPEQAYGDTGTPDGRIPGGSTLFFKIELLQVLSAGIGGEATLLGVDGKQLTTTKQSSKGGSSLLGADGKPLV